MYFSLQGWLVYTCLRSFISPCPLNRTLRKFSAVVLAQHYGDTAEIPRQRRQSQPERCLTRSGA